MRRLLLLSILLLPLAALAQNYSNAPLFAVTNGETVAPPQYGPADDQATDMAQAAPAAAAPAAAPPSEPVDTDKMLANFPAAAISNAGKTPPTPIQAAATIATPNNKLWPRDTTTIFTRHCAHFHQEFVEPCNCIITNLMQQMTHAEFMQLSQAGKIDDDARVQSIRQSCATKPQQHQQ